MTSFYSEDTQVSNKEEFFCTRPYKWQFIRDIRIVNATVHASAPTVPNP